MGVIRKTRRAATATTPAVAATILLAATGAAPAAATAPAGALAREQVPAPQVSGPVSGGRFGRPFTSSPVPLGAAGYTENEYFLTGTATAYTQAGTWGSDGRWPVRAAGRTPYETRILVRRPANPARFNGTVVVEWLNVSAGADTDPDYMYGNAELLRAGFAWVGVSAQQVGVAALRKIDPVRYAPLAHPGDTFSYGIFSQAAQALRHPAGVDPLGGLRPRRLIADGESQSSERMVTYENAIQPVDRLFDGFLIHSRSATPAPISQAPQADQPSPAISRTRTDQPVPVLTVQTESDLLGTKDSYAARQADGPRYRLWELPGMSHVDAYLLALGRIEVAPFVPDPPAPHCALPPNDGQERYVMDTAFARLGRWVRTGVPPAAVPRVRITPGAEPAIVRDDHGNALGGVRTPALQAPIATLTGTGNTGDSWQCPLWGTTQPFPAARLATLYPDHRAYVAAVARAARADVRAGFLLPADAAEIVRTARAAPVPPAS